MLCDSCLEYSRLFSKMPGLSRIFWYALYITFAVFDWSIYMAYVFFIVYEHYFSWGGSFSVKSLKLCKVCWKYFDFS